MYSGHCRGWRLHLNGAWNLILSRRPSEPWKTSEEAWLTAQSLCLLKIRCDTVPQLSCTTLVPNNEHDIELDLISSVASRQDFGFTAGATSALMSCILETTQLLKDKVDDNDITNRERAASLYHRILQCSFSDSEDRRILQLHHRIFQIGTLVYFHRSIWNSPPKTIAPLLDEVLCILEEYSDHAAGYVTMWPVFVAAVEGYDEDRQKGFKRWLDDCDNMGAANRKDVRIIVESVWSERIMIWQHSGGTLELGDIAVDWREVMLQRQVDVLLV